MVHGRRRANEQRVELRDAPVVVAVQELDVEAVRARGTLEPPQGLAVRRRRTLVVVDQDRQVVLVLRAAARAPGRPAAREVVLDDVAQEVAVALRNLADRNRRDAAQAPRPRRRRFRERCPHQRHGEQIEQRAAQIRVALGHVAAEVDAELEALRLDLVQRALDELLELVVGAQQRARFDVLDRRDARHRAVAARRREQRYVVAGGLILVGVAQVIDADVAHAREALIAQIRVRADDLGCRKGQRPLLGMVDDDQCSHRRACFGSMTSRFAS